MYFYLFADHADSRYFKLFLLLINSTLLSLYSPIYVGARVPLEKVIYTSLMPALMQEGDFRPTYAAFKMTSSPGVLMNFSIGQCPEKTKQLEQK